MKTDKEKLIYLAGIVDGEGCFWRGNHTNGRGEKYMESRLHIVNTDEMLMRWVKENYGGYLWLRKHVKNPKWKDAWRWSLSGRKCEALARDLLPYLIVKREQVKRVLHCSTKG